MAVAVAVNMVKHLRPRKPKVDATTSTRTEKLRGLMMDLLIDSSPILFHNDPQRSAGAILEGQVRLRVTKPLIELQQIHLQLLLVLSTRKSATQHCPACAIRTTEICNWEFFRGPTSLPCGTHCFPFGQLLKGTLPTTTHSTVADLDYILAAKAETASGETISYHCCLVIGRAIAPEPATHFIRLFNPLDITATIYLAPVIITSNDIPVKVRLSAIVQYRERRKHVVWWSLRKLNWWIEESQKLTASLFCGHSKEKRIRGKRAAHSTARILSSSEVEAGWKTDLEQNSIDVEFHASCKPKPPLKPNYSMNEPNALEIRHKFHVQMVLMKESAPVSNPDRRKISGDARRLHTSIDMILTAPVGSASSWDQAQSPVYDESLSSPPHYADI